jgi:hypothetical protein
MRLLRDHPGIACGIHLTVVAEFADYRWGPLAPRDRVPSLLDEPGFFFNNDRQAELLARATTPDGAYRSRMSWRGPRVVG